MTGSSTKARETFDYKIKLRQGEYNYLDPVLAKKGKEIELLPSEYLLMPTEDIEPFDIETFIDSGDEYLEEGDENYDNV